MKQRVYILGDKLSVDGDHTLAVEAWKEQLRILAGMLILQPKVFHVCFMCFMCVLCLLILTLYRFLVRPYTFYCPFLGNIQQTCSKM